MHSPLLGVAVGAGLHLLVCAVDPSELVQVRDAIGAPLQKGGNTFEMDYLHRVHIAAGGLATIFLACLPILQFFRSPETSVKVAPRPSRRRAGEKQKRRQT